MPVVSYQLHRDIGVITIDSPPVNALSQAIREGLKTAIEAAQGDESKALLMICAGRTFIAGADIREFGKPVQAPSLPEMLESIENSQKPVIAAIHGSALGGGFETALCCHYRCAGLEAKVGLPEVKLGLLPGAGGTQRVPRLAGVEAALELIISGKPSSATKAKSLGLIDRVIEGDLLSGAIDYAREIVARQEIPRRIRDINIDSTHFDDEFFNQYRTKFAKRSRGQINLQHIISCVEAAVKLPMDEGLQRERGLFLECRDSQQSSAMRHLFFAERASAKIKDLAKGTQIRPIKNVAIIGGGTMGGGIAMNFANVGIPVTLLEINDGALQRGIDIVAKNYSISVSKGKLTAALATERQALITGTTDYADLADVDMVIEAVFENLAIKKEVFSKLDEVCKAGAILASNTSYQDVDAIAAATSRPQDVIGLHFFSPANVMKLLEVVRGDKTSDQVIATAMAVAKTIGKVAVLSKVCYGFIGNRMLRHYAREAQLCMIEGSSPEQIDKVMVDWGMAMGPLAVGDLAGLDIGYKARQALSIETRGAPETYCIADALVEMGRLGQKSGAGYYQYDVKTRARSSDPAVKEVIAAQSKKLAITRRELSDEEILNRLTFAWINEGFKILEEGIAQRPSDIDVVYAFGYGFPTVRGGPMYYADSLGLKKVFDTICLYHKQYKQDYWIPSALLRQLVDSDTTLAQWAEAQV